MTHFPHQFEAPIEHHDVGSEKYAYTVVYVPDDLLAQLPMREFPRLRITGEINDHPFDASLTPARGRWYVLLSKKLLKAAGLSVGDDVDVRFEIADQEHLDIPPALTEALNVNEHLEELWNRQTAGKRRGLAYRVSSAKTPATQARRIDEVYRILKGEIDLRGNPKK